jgi:dihydroxyacetone kinase-like predicted kinase
MRVLQSFGIAVLVASAFVGTYRPTPAQAQIAPVTAQVPPALRAAILSGNSNAIIAAINTLSAGNPTLAANLAAQTASFAESMIATNPQAAVSAAQAAVNIVSNGSVQNSAPAAANNVAAIAARIVVNPAAILVAPQQAAAVAVQAVQVATVPVVYQANPAASVQVATNSYTTVNNPAVMAASPTAAQQVTSTINQASSNPNLSGSNPSNASQMNSILVGQQTTTNQNPVEQPSTSQPDVFIQEPVQPDSELINNASPT